MKDKTILGSWCTEPNCKFIDSKHIQIELVAHIWYSYDNCSKTDVINKKICFVKEIVFDELNDEVEILEEEKKIPEKLEDISEIKCVDCKVEIDIIGNKTLFDTDTPIVTEHCIYKINQLIKNQKKIIDYLKSKGDE